MAGDTPAPETTWEGTGVSIATIGNELSRVFRNAALATVGGKADRLHITHTRVMNLVVYAADAAAVSEVANTVTGLGTYHPSRIIMISADLQSPTSQVDAHVTANCQPGPKDQQVCTEEIRLTARGEVAQHTDSVIMPLLVPGLPVFVWWPGDPPTQHHLLEQMAEVCDRLVVDSEGFTDPAHDLAALAEVAAERSDQCAFSDLTWARLTPWRELVAQLFDPDHLRPLLQHFDRVTVEHYPLASRQLEPTAQALLFAAWLCSRLGWQFEGIAEQTLTCRRADGQPVAVVSVAGTQNEPHHGDLTKVSIEASEPQRSAVFIIESTAAEEITSSVDLDGTPFFRRTGHVADRSAAELLAEELEVFGHDDIYEQSLALVARFQ